LRGGASCQAADTTRRVESREKATGACGEIPHGLIDSRAAATFDDEAATAFGSPPAAQRDPALVGHWTYTERYSSGDFFANTTYQMLVHPDGTYQYGAGNVSLGGNYQGNTGQTGNVVTGQWRTEGGVVHVMEQGSSQWTPYARYYVEEASMMLTLADGTRQLWERAR
jgi:hypothetical protein